MTKETEERLEKWALKLIEEVGEDVSFNCEAVGTPLIQFISSELSLQREELSREIEGKKKPKYTPEGEKDDDAYPYNRGLTDALDIVKGKECGDK